jgi:nucleotide-binding universal stress UspA family protein
MNAKKKNTMLVPVDFSDIATHALRHAVQLAKHFDNHIALLHVIEEGFFNSIFGIGDDRREEARKIAHTRLNALSEEILKGDNIECSAIVKIGKIYTSVSETATELGCDSIVMGSNGASGLEQIIGSNASKTIMQANVPVIVVKSDRQTNAYKNIVFPLDLTIESRQKVSWAIHLGKSYQSTIHIITFKVDDEETNVSLRASLRQVTRLLEEQGVMHTEHVLDKIEKDFSLETIAFAEKMDADLIMVMSQQESSSVGDFIIGTEAQQMVNQSQKIAVMCIKPKPLGYASEFIV